MRGFVGIGQSDSVEQAVDEATRGLKNADLLILTAPYGIAEKAADILASKYPNVPMIGTTGGAIAKDSRKDNTIVISAFAGVSVIVGTIDNVKTAPITKIKEFSQNVKAIDSGTNNTICMEFITGSEEKTISTMNSVLCKYNIDLIGSSAFDAPLGCSHLVICNGKTYSHCCAYALIKNNAGKIKLFHENIYEKMGRRPHFATLVDTNTKTLFQLDGKPAFEVYTEETGVDKEDIVSNMLTNPLGRAVGDDIFITQTVSLDANGVMFNGKALYENDSVYTMQLGDYKEIHNSFIDEIKNSMNRISFIYGFESLNRIKLFDKENYTDEFIDSVSKLGNFVCHLSNSQQYKNQQLNQTLVCAVFE